ncbi:MAG: sel1 repeat family protein [Synergistaceae bacterium]|nr:sel1 repeat family protein [Synergistaceae bacterium]
MAETITFEADPVFRKRLDLVCTELDLDAAQVIAEAFNAYFRKLITDGKINADFSYIAQGDSESETEYSLEDPDTKAYPLTEKEVEGLSKSQLKNYEKAKQGDAKALNVMATYYETGNGFAKDYSRAAYWYKLAADRGNTNAQYHLAVICNKIEDNPLRAYYWFEVARLCGFNVTAIHKDYILRISERLSARQLKFAQEEAAKKFAEIQQRIS